MFSLKEPVYIIYIYIYIYIYIKSKVEYILITNSNFFRNIKGNPFLLYYKTSMSLDNIHILIILILILILILLIYDGQLRINHFFFCTAMQLSHYFRPAPPDYTNNSNTKKQCFLGNRCFFDYRWCALQKNYSFFVVFSEDFYLITIVNHLVRFSLCC
eukprot:gene6203-4468_t